MGLGLNAVCLVYGEPIAHLAPAGEGALGVDSIRSKVTVDAGESPGIVILGLLVVSCSYLFNTADIRVLTSDTCSSLRPTGHNCTSIKNSLPRGYM